MTKASPYDTVAENTQEEKAAEEVVNEEEVVKPAPRKATKKKNETIKKQVVESTTIDDQTDDKEESIKVYRINPRELTKDQARAFADLTLFIKEKKVISDNPDDDATIYTTRGTIQSTLASMERLADELEEGNIPEGIEKWNDAVQEAQTMFLTPNDDLFDATVRAGSKWVNRVNFGSEEEPSLKGLTADRKGINPANKGDTRAIALVKALKVLNIGAPAYVPLYQTGIWLKLRTPTAAAFARLDETIVGEKLQYGAITHGSVYSNDSVILRKHVADFILDHVEWTTAPNSDPDYLKSIIKDMDLDIMMWAVALSRYPDGYPYAQACTVDPLKCSHIVEGLVDLRTLVWTDENKLTEFQKRIMNNPRRQVSEEDLRKYQDEFKLNSKSRIVIDGEGSRLTDENDAVLNGIVLNIEPPTLEQAEEYGTTWIRDLEKIAESVFREKHNEEARRVRIGQETLVNYFRTYGQWVNSISIYEGGVLVRESTDIEELNELFSYLSSDASYVKLFRTEINNYINNNIVTLIGTLNYECPNCGKKQDTPDGSHYLVLPMDVLSTFFTLIRYSVRRSILLNNM